MEFRHILTNLSPSTEYEVSERQEERHFDVWLSGIFQVRLFCANQFGVSETTDAVRVKTKDIGRKFYTLGEYSFQSKSFT